LFGADATVFIDADMFEINASGLLGLQRGQRGGVAINNDIPSHRHATADLASRTNGVPVAPFWHVRLALY
jgi:hypothetical protein